MNNTIPANLSSTLLGAFPREDESTISEELRMSVGVRPSVCDTRIVNRVVDSLDVRAYEPRLPSDFLCQELSVWRSHISEWILGKEEHFVNLEGIGTFRVQSDDRPYEIVLINPQICDIRIWNPDKWASSWPNTGQFYINFRSSFMQFSGLAEAQDLVERIVNLLCAGTPGVKPLGYRRISRADLACDVQVERDMQWADLSNFICRTRYLDIFTSNLGTPYHPFSKEPENPFSDSKIPLPPPRGNKGGATYMRGDEKVTLPTGFPLAAAAHTLLSEYVSQDREQKRTRGSSTVSRVIGSTNAPQTIYFGKFKGQLYARRYNKLLSLPVQNKLYMLDVWASNGWDQSSPVWRTEFSLSGDFLRKVCTPVDGVCDLRELSVFVESLGPIWSYLTTKWLREIDPTEGDSNLWRAPTSRGWQVIQQAWLAPEGGVVRLKPVPKPNLDHLMSQAAGVALTCAALLHSRLTRMDHEYSDETLEDTAGRICGIIYDHITVLDTFEQRRAKLGHDVVTDTYLSAVYRRQYLARGLGS